ncbi:MAG TPA: O-antigen ligase family protein, partial [Bacteroidia bacterium]|nr:O-antigen ligase family protein [Bacteroidia bacterium]
MFEHAKARPWIVALACLAWLGLSIGLYWRNYPHSPTYLPLVPLGLLALLLAARHFEGFMMAMLFTVPMSVSITDMGGGMGAALPGEAMLVLAAIGILMMVLSRQINPLPLLLHPIGIMIILHLVWAFISMLGSTLTEVSLKFLASRTAYILVYYIGFGTLFLNPDRRPVFFKSYLWGLAPVMVWAIFHLAQYGLSRKFSPVMAEPFYDDHTVFGACLAMVLPLAGWIALRDQLRTGPKGINWAWPMFLLVTTALLLSFSRAAWMGIGVIGGFYLLFRLRIRFRTLAIALVVVAAGAWLGRDALVERFQQNENVSGEDVFSTAASVTNVNTDDSNKERINRWACAIRMFEQRPWMGFGPGTYERKYGDFQVLSEITRISTWVGDRGDAHSEYLGVLAEQGIPGLVFLGGIFLMS